MTTGSNVSTSQPAVAGEMRFRVRRSRITRSIVKITIGGMVTAMVVIFVSAPRLPQMIAKLSSLQDVGLSNQRIARSMYASANVTAVNSTSDARLQTIVNGLNKYARRMMPAARAAETRRRQSTKSTAEDA